MSWDVNPNEMLPEMLPFWITHKPRFWGAQLLDNFLYAVVNLLEAIFVLLTFWRDNGTDLTLNFDQFLKAQLYRWRTEEELVPLKAKYKFGDSPKDVFGDSRTF